MKSQIGYTLTFTNKSKTKTDYLLPMLCLALTAYSIVFSVISAFNLPFSSTKLLICATLFTGILFLAFVSFKKYKIFIGSALLVVWSSLFFIFKENFLKGFAESFSFISETIEQNQKIGWEYQSFASYDSKLMELAFIFILFPIVLILAYNLFGKLNAMAWLLVVVPIYEPMIFFNQLPNLWCFAILIIVGIIVLILSKVNSSLLNNAEDIRNIRNANTSAMIIATAVGLFLIITLLVINETGYGLFLEKMPARTNAKNVITEVLSPTFEEKTPPQGGITGGNFSKTDNFSFTGETALTIEADKLMGNLYLRGFVGGAYTSKGWEQVKLGGDKSVDIIGLDSMELSNIFHCKKRDLKITLGKAASNKYDYQPYFVLNRKGNSFEYFEVANYDNNLFLLSKEQIYNTLLNSMAVSKGKLNKEILDKHFKEEEKYYETIKDKYLSVPKSAEAVYEEYKPLSSKFNNTENAIKYVMADLASRANYTLSPGKTPENKDFVTYFLYENKKGYCTHFASAAVLIFRSMNIPARYVEGYVVNASEYVSGSQTEEGKYLIDVKDTASHAWCEVYLKGCGWIPVEVTPGLTPMPTGDIADARGDAIEYESEGQSRINQIAVEMPKIEEQMAEGGATETSGKDYKSNGKNRAFNSVIYRILIVIALIVLIIGFVVLFRYLSLRRWGKLLNDSDKKVSILSWFKFFMLVYKDNKYISLEKWARDKEEKEIFEKDSITFAIDVVQKSAYSNTDEMIASNISEEEYKGARARFIYCVCSTYEKLTFIEKVKWLLISRLPLPIKEYRQNLESKVSGNDT